MSEAREIRRARPLLGTFVEISAWGSEEAALRRAVDRAFNVLQGLHARLSAHDPASEVSRLNREAQAGAVAVSRDCWRVLRAAASLARLSDGVFDVTLGAGQASSRDIEFLPGLRVRFARALRVDLGGIAKGYCVDRAVAELRRGGAAGGLVNAGGDLRAFGARAYPLHLRHPDDPRQFVQMGTLRDAALATSASYTSVRERWAGGMLDARSGAPIGAGISVSVRARFAFVADALTKVVAASGPRAAPLLARCRAQAWVFGAQSDARPDSATTAAWELPCAAAA